MSIWLKGMLPLVLQLLGELFRTDGEQKIGLGLKIAILVCIMLSVVAGYLGISYFELYHTTLEAKVEVKRLTKGEVRLNTEVIELEATIKDYETRLGMCKAATNVPSDSYKQRPQQPPRVEQPIRSTRSEPEYSDEYIEELLRAING